MEPAIFSAGQTILASSRDGENIWINMHEDLNQKATRRPAVFLPVRRRSVLVGCTNSDDGARNAALGKASAASQEKSIKLRYDGGPKYPRYLE
jgi:hypothetical protein